MLLQLHNLRSPTQCKQSLRSISLPHGPQTSGSSPPLQNGSSISNIANTDSTSQSMLQEVGDIQGFTSFVGEKIKEKC